MFGCGGIGSEVVKLLRGHRLTVVDFDRVEISNLNRQFFYTKNSCGRYKAECIGQQAGCKSLVGKVEEMEPGLLSQFDVVFGCLDSVSSRMELNYLFRQSACEVLIDCGVEGMRAHAKRVVPGGACLYCIKELYSTAAEPHLCSLSHTGQAVTELNREKIIMSMVSKEKDRMASQGRSEAEGPASIPPSSEKGMTGKDDEGGRTPAKGDAGTAIESIVDRFNAGAPPQLATSAFEVQGYFSSIIPNVCVINAICASLAVRMLYDQPGYDFVFYDGSAVPFTRKITMEKDPGCILCKNA